MGRSKTGLLHRDVSYAPAAGEVEGVTMKLSSDVSILKSIEMGLSGLLSHWKMSACANTATGFKSALFLSI